MVVRFLPGSLRRKTPDASQMELVDVPPFEDLAAITGVEG